MINSIDEAVAHAREVAENWKSQLVNCVSEEGRCKCKECAAEHDQLADWLTELQERREADRWIPVSERLPEKDGYYLITRLNYGEAVTDKRSFNRRNGYGSFVCNNVTAWKEMPKPYESEVTNETNNRD